MASSLAVAGAAPDCQEHYGSVAAYAFGYRKAEAAGPENAEQLVGKVIWGYQAGNLNLGTVLSVSRRKGGGGKEVVLAKIDRGADWREDVRYTTLNLTNNRFHISNDLAKEAPPPGVPSPGVASAAYYASLSTSEQLALMDYFIIGQTMNDHLREQAGLLALTGAQAERIRSNLGQINETIRTMDGLFKRAPRTEKAFQVFRGEVVPRGSRSLGIGTEVDDYPHFMSTAVDVELAKTFAGSELSSRVVWNITVPLGSRIIYLHQAMGVSGETPKASEVLLPRNTRLRITGIRERADYLEVTAEAVLSTAP